MFFVKYSSGILLSCCYWGAFASRNVRKRNIFHDRSHQRDLVQADLNNSSLSGLDISGSHRHVLNFTGQCRIQRNTLGIKCQLCEGDCESDADCAEGLACFIRNSNTPGQGLPVPGCDDNPKSLFAKDFCYNKTLAPCGDLSVFLDVHNNARSCEYVKYDDMYHRCELYGHFCRETCGYCRYNETGKPRRKNKNNIEAFTNDYEQ